MGVSDEMREIADRLRKGFDESYEAGLDVWHDLCADAFEVVHHPPIPADGVWEKSALVEAHKVDVAVLRKLMPNDLRREIQAITVSDDTIRWSQVMTGTLPDGTAVNLAFDNLVCIVGGQIVRNEVFLDMQAPEWQRVMSAILPGYEEAGLNDDPHALGQKSAGNSA